MRLNQKTATPGSNISSVAGICIVLIIGGAIICPGFVLPVCASWLQTKRKVREHASHARKMDKTLQLQILAFENADLGAWDRRSSLKPVTLEKEKFAMPGKEKLSLSIIGEEAGHRCVCRGSYGRGWQSLAAVFEVFRDSKSWRAHNHA